MKSHKSAFITLFLVVATELIGFGLIIPVLPQLAYEFNITALPLGILLSAYSFAQFLAAPILGKLSDKYGRKPILVISKLGSALSYVILAYAVNFWGFLFARLLDGLTGGNIAVARAYAADITTPEDRSKGMAIIGISFGVGFILGPALGGFLYGVGQGHTVAALVAGSLSFIAFLFTVFFLKEPQKSLSKTESNLTYLSRLSRLSLPRLFLFLCFIQFVYMVIFSGFETTFSVFTANYFQFTPQKNSWLFMYIGLIALVIQGYLSRKSLQNYFIVILFGMLLFCSGIIIFSTFHTIPFLYLGLTGTAIGASLLNVFLPGFLSKQPPKNIQGQTMGVFESISSISRIIGPLISFSGFVYSISHLYFIYSIILLLSLISMGLYYYLIHKLDNVS